MNSRYVQGGRRGASPMSGIVGLGDDNPCFRNPAPLECFSASGVAKTVSEGIAREAGYENARNAEWYAEAMRQWEINGKRTAEPVAPLVLSTDPQQIYRAMGDDGFDSGGSVNVLANGNIVATATVGSALLVPIVRGGGGMANPGTITQLSNGNQANLAAMANGLVDEAQGLLESAQVATGMPIWGLGVMAVVGLWAITKGR